MQVTPVQVSWPSVTRDDRHVVFASSLTGVQSLWMVSIDGGAPIQVAKRFASNPELSPDGKAVAFSSQDDQNRWVLITCDLPACSLPRSVPVPSASVNKWTPDGKGITYATGTPRNIWVHPLDGTPARQLTHFTDEREIADLAWSYDGTRLAVVRATTTSDIVLFKGLKK